MMLPLPDTEAHLDRYHPSSSLPRPRRTPDARVEHESAVTALLTRRRDLIGVVPHADLVAEAVGWSA